MIRARIALWLLHLAARIDIVVVLVASEAVVMNMMEVALREGKVVDGAIVRPERPEQSYRKSHLN